MHGNAWAGLEVFKLCIIARRDIMSIGQGSRDTEGEKVNINEFIKYNVYGIMRIKSRIIKIIIALSTTHHIMFLNA